MLKLTESFCGKLTIELLYVIEISFWFVLLSRAAACGAFGFFSVRYFEASRDLKTES